MTYIIRYYEHSCFCRRLINLAKSAVFLHSQISVEFETTARIKRKLTLFLIVAPEYCTVYFRFSTSECWISGILSQS